MEEQTRMGEHSRTTKTKENIGAIGQETAVAWTRVEMVYVERLSGMENYFDHSKKDAQDDE